MASQVKISETRVMATKKDNGSIRTQGKFSKAPKKQSSKVF